MRWVILTSVALLCACSDPGEAAEKRYKMVEETGSRGEICDASKAVADAYLKAGNNEKYKWWHTMSDARCITAQIEGRDGRPGEMVVENIQ